MSKKKKFVMQSDWPRDIQDLVKDQEEVIRKASLEINKLMKHQILLGTALRHMISAVHDNITQGYLLDDTDLDRAHEAIETVFNGKPIPQPNKEKITQLKDELKVEQLANDYLTETLNRVTEDREDLLESLRQALSEVINCKSQYHKRHSLTRKWAKLILRVQANEYKQKEH